MSFSPESLSDEELVEYVRTRDQESYVILLRRYEDRLLRYARYLIRDHDRAVDAVQEACIKAFINLNGFNTKKKFSSWIYRIVHNEAMNIIRRYKKETHLHADPQLAETIPDKTDIPEDMDRAQTRIMIRQSLEKLPLIYREPLVLYFLEDQTYEQISDVLRIPINTVASRLRRGKMMLKALCKTIR